MVYYDCINCSQPKSPPAGSTKFQCCFVFFFTLTKLTGKKKKNNLLYIFPAGWSEGKATKPKASHWDSALRRADLTCRRGRRWEHLSGLRHSLASSARAGGTGDRGQPHTTPMVGTGKPPPAGKRSPHVSTPGSRHPVKCRVAIVQYSC